MGVEGDFAESELLGFSPSRGGLASLAGCSQSSQSREAAGQFLPLNSPLHWRPRGMTMYLLLYTSFSLGEYR